MEDLSVHTHKLKVTIRDHRAEVRLPEDFPEGPAEVIVLTNRKPRAQLTGKQQALAALAELRSVPLTPEEEQVLNDFENFRQAHPIRFSSLTSED